MRFHPLYIIISTLLLACNREPLKENPFNGWDNSSVRHALETQTFTIEEQIYGYGQLGISYNITGKFDSARIYLNRALSLTGGREYQGGRLITNLANSYGFEGRYVEALKYYMEALQVCERAATSSYDQTLKQVNLVRTMANLAEVHYLTGNPKQALHYAIRASEINSTAGVHYIMPQYLYVIASVHLGNGELIEAEKLMRETYAVADTICKSNIKWSGDASGMYMYVAYGLEGLARVSLARMAYAEAFDYAAQALYCAELHGDHSVTAKMLVTFSDIHLAQGNYAESGRYAQQALHLFPDYLKLNPNAAFNIATARLFTGNTGEAYRHFSLYSKQMKENTDNRFRETMAGMEAVYESEKKEMRITNLERRIILDVFISAGGVLLAVLVWIILRQKIKNERKEKQLAAANAVLEWEKKERKRFASDLHDGINGMLAAIKIKLATAEHLHSVRQQLDNCIETIRRMARGMMPASLERYGIKAALEDYCQLFPNVNFHFFGSDVRIEERLELTVYYCAYELVNNSYRHSGAENIHVQLVQDAASVSLTVQDDGCGFNPKTVASGAGLKNISNRIAAFGGTMDIASAHGTEVYIELKIRL
ncbi:MAG: sensor histidine kinase [Cytophagaceae bacterium]|nr:sensor histidine kinase [Cytophagaceae bacterium]